MGALALTSSFFAGAEGGASEPNSGSIRPALSPYFEASFSASRLPYTFGQAPSWTANGHVLSSELDSAGIKQIYRSNLDGRDQICMTCTTVKGPSALPQAQPRGRWILFESFGQQPIHIGGPGFGGYGGDLYVMHSNGTHVYRLTTNSDPQDGAQFGSSSGRPYDNFHAYWSPDGKHVIWTHTEADSLSEGGEKWEIMLGNFAVNHGVPSLTDVEVVGPPYGAYETQPWSPDGKGFLFFAAGGYRSPYQPAPPGWGNARLYYMRLFGKGASPAHPMVTPITDNEAVYQEQAVFTPDMKDVIMMSNRGATLGSWYDEIAAAAQRTSFDASDTGASQTLQFLADFEGVDFAADLYIVDGPTGAIRRLTTFNAIVPEFFWDSTYTKLLTTLTRNGSHASLVASYTFRFHGLSRANRRIPRTTPAWLYGKPIDVTRVGSQAQSPTQEGPINNGSVAVARPDRPAPAFPHANKGTDTSTVPSIVASYLAIWESDLTALGAEANESFATQNALTRLLNL